MCLYDANACCCCVAVSLCCRCCCVVNLMRMRMRMRIEMSNEKRIIKMSKEAMRQTAKVRNEEVKVKK